MAHQTFSAPEAYITIDGIPVGIMRNVRCTENLNRADVQGLGSVVSQEVPVTKVQCSLNAGMYFIKFTEDVMKRILNRGTDVNTLLNSIALGDFPLSIIIYRKTATPDDKTKLVTNFNKTGETIISINDFYIESQDFDLSEGSIAGTNISGRYLTPVTFPA